MQTTSLAAPKIHETCRAKRPSPRGRFDWCMNSMSMLPLSSTNCDRMLQ